MPAAKQTREEKLTKLKGEFARYLMALKSGYTSNEQQNMVRRLSDTLNDELETTQQKLVKFGRQIVSFKPMIEQSIDRPFIRFIKNILNILSFGYAAEWGLFSPASRATASSNIAYNELDTTLQIPDSGEEVLTKVMLTHIIAEMQRDLATKLKLLSDIEATEAQLKEASRDTAGEASLATIIEKVFNRPGSVRIYPGEDVIIYFGYIENSASAAISAVFSPFFSDDTLNIESGRHSEEVHVNPPGGYSYHTDEPYIQVTFPVEKLERVKQGLQLSQGVNLGEHVHEPLAYC